MASRCDRVDCRMRSVHRLLLVLACGLPLAADAQDFEAERRALVREIRNDVAQTSFYIGRSKLDERVMQALATVPRHRFVPDHLQRYAYDNRPLPIGHGQTISQPFIVALMTDLLEPAADDVVLEIGTGSGYQAAVLAGLVKEVYSIEIVAPLGESARARLAALGYDNVQTRIGDGYYGWAEHAPYDAIIV
ncbi:MAG: protein-L-isoaspartate O-methyltransferase, partial [Xanthomonadales bacterium]|nr:protein-L-isoaspartate O-methyltransferase [Xanthomonadales bacterium]NIX12426.1 protein-L-isoaspartate O-methyltransferase [Xanthomonadales bacterium]